MVRAAILGLKLCALPQISLFRFENAMERRRHPFLQFDREPQMGHVRRREIESLPLIRLVLAPTHHFRSSTHPILWNNQSVLRAQEGVV